VWRLPWARLLSSYAVEAGLRWMLIIAEVQKMHCNCRLQRCGRCRLTSVVAGVVRGLRNRARRWRRQTD
jgi:hypothetical protein